VKLKSDLGEITIPLAIEEVYKIAKKEGLKGEDKEYWEQESFETCFNDWWTEEGCEKFPSEGFMEEEMAVFLFQYDMGTVAFGGGYPKEGWMFFEDNGYRYSICAYGWSSDLEDKNIDINLVGYKEKIKKGEKHEIKRRD